MLLRNGTSARACCLFVTGNSQRRGRDSCEGRVENASLRETWGLFLSGRKQAGRKLGVLNKYRRRYVLLQGSITLSVPLPTLLLTWFSGGNNLWGHEYWLKRDFSQISWVWIRRGKKRSLVLPLMLQCVCPSLKTKIKWLCFFFLLASHTAALLQIRCRVG